MFSKVLSLTVGSLGSKFALFAGASAYALAGSLVIYGAMTPTKAMAQSAPSGGWCTSSSTTGDFPRGYLGTLSGNQHYSTTTGCTYKTGAEACAQWATSWPGPIVGLGPDNAQWWNYACDGPTLYFLIDFNCDSGFAIAPGKCVSQVLNSDIPVTVSQADSTPQQSSAHDSCSQPTGGQTPHPIDILRGAKIYRRTDFASVDGGLRLDRIYNSQGIGGTGFGATGPTAGMGNWNLGYSFEVQFGDARGAPGTTSETIMLALTSPSGFVAQFVKQSDGSLTPYTSAQGLNSQVNYSLKTIDPWPAVTHEGWDLRREVITRPMRFEMTDADGNKWTITSYTEDGYYYEKSHVTKLVKRDGNEVIFNYGSDNSLQSMSDHFGNTITFVTTKVSGQFYYITKANLPGGSSVNYVYDTSGPAGSVPRMTSVQFVNPSNVVVDSETYQYGNSNFPAGITSVLDHGSNIRWSTTYDAQGRATSSAGGGGVDAYTVAYSAPGATFSRTVTNAMGKQSVYNYTQTSAATFDPKLTSTSGVASANCPASASSNTFGSDGLVASSYDELGRRTDYQWDGRGLVTSLTEAVGTPAQKTTTLTWSTTSKNITSIASPTNTLTYTYDTFGRLITQTITDTTSSSVPYSTNGQARTTTYEWGNTGGGYNKLLSIDGPLAGTGDKRFYTYNTSGFLATITDEIGKISSITAWDSRGAPLSIVDSNSVITNITYDIHGRPLTTIVNPGAAQKQFSFEYDAVGNLAKIFLPTGTYLQYSYDTGSRLLQINNDKNEKIILTPNAVGQPTLISTKNSSNTIVQQQTIVYDEIGRLIQTIGNASVTPTSLAYDKVGNVTTLTDGRSKITSKTFDALNRVTQVTNAENKTVKLGYNSVGAVTSHKDGRNLETTLVTNGFGEIIREVSPDRGTRTYWYDTAGRIIKLVDGDNEETDFTYDNAGRLLTKTFPGATWENLTYNYDSTANGNKGNGRLTNVTEQSGATGFEYDTFGRVTKDAKSIQGLAYNVLYAYDKNDNITQLTLPSGRVVTYTRDTAGVVTAISTKPSSTGTVTNIATSVSYMPFGPLKSLTYGNALTLTRTYNTNYWLTRTQVKNGTSSVFDLTYDYYDDGRLGEIVDNAATGRTVYMALSDAGRLTYAGGPWGQESFSWDEAGNRIGDYLTVAGSTTYDNAITSGVTNRLVKTTDGAGVTKRTLLYRAGGDLYSDTVAGGMAYTYAYGARKRLVQVKAAGITAATYGYDFKEQRVWRSVPLSTPIHYIFDERGHLLAEHNGNTGALIREYIWLDEMPLAVIDSTSTPVIYYIHTGHLDEPQVMTNTTKAKVWDAYVTPFGKAKVFSTASANVDFRLPGQWFQVEAAGSGLNQNGARDYDPSLGRYIEVDPVGLFGGQNPYAYVDGQPYDLTDPSGRIPVPIITGIIGGIVGGGANLAGQAYMTAGKCINWKSVGVSAAVGAVAGAAAPFVARTPAGAVGLASVSNYVQYNITQMVNGDDVTLEGAAWSLGTGALGGVVGGRFSSVVTYDVTSKFLDRSIAQSLNQAGTAAANTGASSLTRNFLGGLPGNTDWPPKYGSAAWQCGCK